MNCALCPSQPKVSTFKRLASILCDISVETHERRDEILHRLRTLEEVSAVFRKGVEPGGWSSKAARINYRSENKDEAKAPGPPVSDDHLEGFPFADPLMGSLREPDALKSQPVTCQDSLVLVEKLRFLRRWEVGQKEECHHCHQYGCKAFEDEQPAPASHACRTVHIFGDHSREQARESSSKRHRSIQPGEPGCKLVLLVPKEESII